MLNAERVKLMTQAATCYQKQEKKAMRINEFYKKDYINYNVIKSVFAFTLAYALIFAIIVLYNSEWILIHTTRGAVIFLVAGVVIYIIGAALFGAVSSSIFTKKYQDARDDIKKYQQLLLKLNRLYEAEDVKEQADKEDII
ncbi:MAG: hypothetical protein IJM37_07475 [Lachnospiraceae bacterium]|nr:hypothetical protein [Lachnospiraceae bacterium]